MRETGETISAAEALRIISIEHSAKCVDVRSEDEFAKGAIPQFISVPILNNNERREVGICFKHRGQEAAIELGHKLVDNHRDKLVEKWRAHLLDAKWPLVTCWRGGLRSKTAAEWITSAGGRAIRIEGGTKALRNELLGELATPCRFVVVCGPTGSGKTQLLERSQVPNLNLEKMANHRGSSFGAYIHSPQPSQITFENEIAFKLLQMKTRESGPPRALVEDESRAIGHVQVPSAILEQIQCAKIVRLNVDLSERANNILNDYVTNPLKSGTDPRVLESHYESCLFRIRSKLGGQMHRDVLQIMKTAFERSDDGLHRDWICLLLENYYDKTYQYSESKLSRKIAYEGDWQQCLTWIQNQFA